MRCKRCGELLEPTDTRCPVCGKTLTPPRRRAPAQKPSETNIKLPQLEKFIHAYSEDAARGRMLQLVTVGAVAAAIALLVLVYVGVGNLQTAVGDLDRIANAQLQAMQNQPPVSVVEPTEGQTDPTEENTEAPTDPPAQVQPMPLSEQDVQADLTLYRSANGTYAAAAMDLGSYEDRADAWVNTAVTENGCQTNVSWILENSDDRLDMKLSESYGGADAQVAVTLSWDTEGNTFRSLTNPVCIWECRTAGGQWASVPTDYLNPIAGGCELKMTADQLQILMAQYSEMELRCYVSMTHPDGGAVRLLVDGILINTEGMAHSGDLLD